MELTYGKILVSMAMGVMTRIPEGCRFKIVNLGELDTEYSDYSLKIYCDQMVRNIVLVRNDEYDLVSVSTKNMNVEKVVDILGAILDREIDESESIHTEPKIKHYDNESSVKNNLEFSYIVTLDRYVSDATHFTDHRKADIVYHKIRDFIDQYGVLTVADLMHITGYMTPVYLMHQYGWDNANNVDMEVFSIGKDHDDVKIYMGEIKHFDK